MTTNCYDRLVVAAEKATDALTELKAALAALPEEMALSAARLDGWEIWPTGGGCTALQKTSHADSTVYAWITDHGGTHHYSKEDRYTVGLYTEMEGLKYSIMPRASDGPRLKAVSDPNTLAECIAWANERLFEPDLFSHLWTED